MGNSQHNLSLSAQHKVQRKVDRGVSTKTKEMKKFISCVCSGHGLLLDSFHDEEGNHPSELYVVVFGSASYFEKPSLRWRIKRAFEVLRTGKIPGGEAVLMEEEAVNLAVYINDFLIKSRDES